MPYGNTHTKLSGIIRDIQRNRAIVEFPQFKKKIPIPAYCIHSRLKQILNQESELEIDTWYLKKIRLIPLFDPKHDNLSD
ncbi:MAG: hypothetical protein DRO88_00270 [Promethearchaeia archaeon]|nr:MAG: hypothetical protein DRO88_00270 [Candidatus Lokiarchaeia archaeon]